MRTTTVTAMFCGSGTRPAAAMAAAGDSDEGGGDEEEEDAGEEDAAGGGDAATALVEAQQAIWGRFVKKSSTSAAVGRSNTALELSLSVAQSGTVSRRLWGLRDSSSSLRGFHAVSRNATQ